jgi:diguanylate cyclase (GGDEF)-like protein
MLAAVTFGAAMVHVARSEAHIPSTVELQIVYFVVMLTMLVSVCLLVSQLAALRERSTQRKKDLSKALEQVQLLATRDELTGLFNRRHMVDLLQAEKLRADRTLRGFAVCVIDVDHFKSVNDQYGHGVGDEALRVLGRILEESLRDTDAVARWGGEEFLIMFTDSNDEAPMQVLERVRLQLSGTPVSHLHPRLRITFSAGLTAYRTGEDIYQVIERADQALYEAKAAGRNCSKRATPPAAAA